MYGIDVRILNHVRKYLKHSLVHNVNGMYETGRFRAYMAICVYGSEMVLQVQGLLAYDPKFYRSGKLAIVYQTLPWLKILGSHPVLTKVKIAIAAPCFCVTNFLCLRQSDTAARIGGRHHGSTIKEMRARYSACIAYDI